MSEARRLTEALGGHWYGSYGQAFCPAHENTRTPALSLSDGDGGRLLAHCYAGCAFHDVMAALRRAGLSQDRSAWTLPGATGPGREAPRAADRAATARRARQADRLWQEALPLPGTPGETYLRSRGITCAPPVTLRYVESCHHPSGVRAPALVARIDGTESFAVHRIYLSPDGVRKADLLPAKAMLGAARGGAVRLGSPSSASSRATSRAYESSTRGTPRDLPRETPGQTPGQTLPLVVTEGIENALSLLCGLLDEPATVWAALSTSGLRTLTLPRVPGHLIIAGDNDPPGRAAVTALSHRATGLGWRVSHLTPPEGRDWNDVLQSMGVRA